MTIKNKLLAGALLAGSALLLPTAASAQVAGLAVNDKIDVIMGSKAFKQGYEAAAAQNAPEIQRMNQLQTEVDTLSAPFDANKDGDLTQDDPAWGAALQQLQVARTAADKNKDGTITGTEVDELRGKNLPALNILEKKGELDALRKQVQLGRLYVVDAIDQKYEAALKSVMTAKKINAVFKPEALESFPQSMVITSQIIEALDRLLPAVPMPIPDRISYTQQSASLHSEIERIILASLYAQAQQQAQQQQQGAQPGAAPAPATTQPAPQPPAGEQPDSR